LWWFFFFKLAMMGVMAEDIRVFDSSYNNARVEVPAETVFELVLPEQPATGFRWKIISGQKPLADYRDPSPPQRGARIMRHLRFQVEQVGEVVISLQLSRSWERDKAPMETFTISLVIRQ
jgi:predicted secreted protein